MKAGAVQRCTGLNSNCALFWAVAVAAAFPDAVIQALVLRIPEVGSELEARLAEKRRQTAAAVLYVLVGGEIHARPYMRL